jgi:hypothetical protein
MFPTGQLAGGTDRLRRARGLVQGFVNPAGTIDFTLILD